MKHFSSRKASRKSALIGTCNIFGNFFLLPFPYASKTVPNNLNISPNLHGIKFWSMLKKTSFRNSGIFGTLTLQQNPFFCFCFCFCFFFRPPFEFLWVRRIFKILKINSWNYTQRLPFGAWGIFSYFQPTTFSKKSSNDLKFSATLRKLPTSVSPPFAHF